MREYANSSSQSGSVQYIGAGLTRNKSFTLKGSKVIIASSSTGETSQVKDRDGNGKPFHGIIVYQGAGTSDDEFRRAVIGADAADHFQQSGPGYNGASHMSDHIPAEGESIRRMDARSQTHNREDHVAEMHFDPQHVDFNLKKIMNV